MYPLPPRIAVLKKTTPVHMGVVKTHQWKGRSCQIQWNHTRTASTEWALQEAHLKQKGSKMLKTKGLERCTRQIQSIRAGVEVLSDNNKTNKNQTNHLSPKKAKKLSSMLPTYTRSNIMGSYTHHKHRCSWFYSLKISNWQKYWGKCPHPLDGHLPRGSICGTHLKPCHQDTLMC